MKNIALALAALGLAACSTTTTCVQPDPVEPSSTSGCWNQGIDCGTPIDGVNVQ